MKAGYINAVIHALKETLANLSEEFDRFEVSDLFIKEQMLTRNPVVVKVGFKGGLTGTVFMSMELQTAINLADLLLVSDGAYAQGFTEIVQSSLKEVTNMFAGMVAMFLSNEKLEIDILPSQLSFGSAVKTATALCPLPASLIISSPVGILEFDVSLAEAS